MSAVKWNSKKIVPASSGWYITRTDAGLLEWRVWDKHWRSWLRRSDKAMTSLSFDWQPGSWKTSRLHPSKLPPIPLTSRLGRLRLPNLTRGRRKRYMRQRTPSAPPLPRSSPQLAERIRISHKRYVIKKKTEIKQTLQNALKTLHHPPAHCDDDLRRTG